MSRLVALLASCHVSSCQIMLPVVSRVHLPSSHVIYSIMSCSASRRVISCRVCCPYVQSHHVLHLAVALFAYDVMSHSALLYGVFWCHIAPRVIFIETKWMLYFLAPRRRCTGFTYVGSRVLACFVVHNQMFASCHTGNSFTHVQTPLCKEVFPFWLSDQFAPHQRPRLVVSLFAGLMDVSIARLELATVVEGSSES